MVLCYLLFSCCSPNNVLSTSQPLLVTFCTKVTELPLKCLLCFDVGMELWSCTSKSTRELYLVQLHPYIQMMFHRQNLLSNNLCGYDSHVNELVSSHSSHNPLPINPDDVMQRDVVKRSSDTLCQNGKRKGYNVCCYVPHNAHYISNPPTSVSCTTSQMQIMPFCDNQSKSKCQLPSRSSTVENF